MRSVLLLIFITLSRFTFAQDFLSNPIDKSKVYILLANPTVYNLSTVEYLVNNRLLEIKKGKTVFIGVYYESQSYDFNNSAEYINKNNLTGFKLQKITGKLDVSNIYSENECTSQLKKAFENSKGILFFGGPDIQPEIYGETNSLSVVTDPGRHLFETTFLFHLLGGYTNQKFRPFLDENPTYAVTGFCLGLQTMNVATGGTLIQDIPAEVYNTTTPETTLRNDRENLHRNYWQELSADTTLMGINFHTINYTCDPFFTKRVKASKNIMPLVYSSHHQAIEKLGKGLKVTALSGDGKIIEGVAHERYPNVFSVQFHPEVPALYEDLYLRKFSPVDVARSYNDIIGRSGLKFHKKYWSTISRALR